MGGNRIADEAVLANAACSHRGDAHSLPYARRSSNNDDNPRRSSRENPKSRKILLWIEAIFPILDWGRSYKLHMLRGDLIAGLSIACLAIPQGIGFAKLANLDSKFGLYTSFVPPLIYAIMGNSRDIAMAPTAVTSILLGNMLQNEIDPSNKLDYQRLTFTATFFAGVTQFALGFFRLGFLIDFLSHATIVGFKAGTAATVGLELLRAMFGIKNFNNKSDIISIMRSIWTNVHHGWSLETLLIGTTVLAFLLLANYVGKKNKKFFWISAIAPLISVIVSTFLVFITHAEKKGVKIVNHIERGVNPSSLHQIRFTGTYFPTGLRIGVVTGVIALTEAMVVGRTFASKKGYHLDDNKEMVALGAMNVIGSMTSCYVSTGSILCSTVNHMSGCNTPLSNIVMSCIVFLTLGTITPLFKYTPSVVFGSMFLSAAIGLFDYEAMILIWKIDKFDFLACAGAFLGVVSGSVEIGLLIAVAISFAKILLQVTRPRTAVLGKIPKTTVYRNIQQYPEATKIPGVLIIRVDSAIYFSNSNYIKERILSLLNNEDEEDMQPRIQHLIVEMSPVTDVDTSGLHALKDLHRNLQNREVKLALANTTVLEKLRTSESINTIGDDNIFLTVEDAVVTLAPKMEPRDLRQKFWP